MLICRWSKRMLMLTVDRILGPAAEAAEKPWDGEVGIVMQRGRPPAWTEDSSPPEGRPSVSRASRTARRLRGLRKAQSKL